LTTSADAGEFGPGAVESTSNRRHRHGRRVGYGWVIVAALAVTETTSWGVLYYGFPVFLKPIEADLGWDRVQLTGAFSLALVCQGVVGIAVGRWLDRHGPRLLMTAGSLGAVLATLLWSRVGSLPAFYLLWAATGAIMATVLYEPAFTVVTKWFPGPDRRRALTALTLVAGLASFIFLPLENWLIETHGWRRALLILAGVLGVVTVPLHALVLRPAPAPPGSPRDRPGERPTPATTTHDAARTNAPAPAIRRPFARTNAPAPAIRRRFGRTTRDAGQPDDAGRPGSADDDLDEHVTTEQALRLPAFRALVAAFVLSSFVSSALAVHQVAYLQERGYSAAFASFATGVLGAMQLPGRLLFGPLLAALPRPAVTTLVFLLTAAGLAVLASGGGVATVWVFVVVYGMGRGMSTLLRATLVGDLFGSRHYGSLTGVIAFATTAALASAPVATGVLVDRLGGYTAVLWLLVATAATAAVAASRIESRRPGRC
jgi:MFS family permease